MALSREELAAVSAQMLPTVAAWLIELRSTSGGADPVALLKSIYDGTGPQSVRARVRLGGVESMAALGPSEFASICEQGRRYL